MMHLRQNSDFREIARYPGQGLVNPMAPGTAPNANFYRAWVLLTDKLALSPVNP